MSKLLINFRSLNYSLAAEQYIRQYFNDICSIHKKIINCKVTLEAVKKQEKKKMFNVSIDVHVPGKEVVCKKRSYDLYSAVHNSFNIIERLLEKCVKRKPIHLDKNNLHLDYQNIERQLHN